MRLASLAIRRPTTTAMCSLALVVLGLAAGSQLKTDLYPSVNLPFCVVTTIYPGAGPEDVEQGITHPLEEAISAVPGVERLSSQSRSDVSLLMVQFRLDVPMAEGVQQVRDAIGLVQRNLPRAAQQPQVAPYDVAAQPVLVFAAATDSAQPSAQLMATLEQQVRPRLEQVPGVATARILGGLTQEVRVAFDPNRLRPLGLSPHMLVERLRAENQDVPAGRYLGQGAAPQQPDGALPALGVAVGVRVAGALKGLEALRGMILGMGPTGPVRLSDVADVQLQPSPAHTLVRSNGRPAVAVEIIKQAGANTVSVSRAARAELAALQTQLGPALSAEILLDAARAIEANAHEVWVAIGFGGAMAILVILLFLLDLRGTLIAALALPTSVIGTLCVLWLFGFSLNQLTLLGLSLAIGLLIDDAVVVRESITRRLEAGDGPRQAAEAGTQQVAMAVMATTFTLCAVFLPVAFMSGMVGQFFRQFGVTISAAVLLSLWVAFTLDPMLSARFARARRGPRTGVAAALERGYAGLERRYAKSLGWVLAHRWQTASLALLMVGLSLVLMQRLGTDFLVTEDRSQLRVSLRLPAGTDLATTAALSAKAEVEAQALPGVRGLYAVIGPDAEADRAEWRVALVDKASRGRSLEQCKQDLRALLADMPQFEATVSDPPLLEGLGEWPPLWIMVAGPDLAVLRAEADWLARRLAEVPGTADVRLLERAGPPELQFEIQRAAALQAGLAPAWIGAQVRLAMVGEAAGSLRLEGRSYPLQVQAQAEAVASEAALARLDIWPYPGTQARPQPVPLGQVATAHLGQAPAVIAHELRQRQLGVSAQLHAGANLGAVSEAVRTALDAHPLPEGYHYIHLGMQREMADMQRSMGLAAGLGLLFILMILASQFESLAHPFTVLLSLPLALVGAVLGLAVVGSSVSMGACIGLILLLGLVTKNAILLVDGALQARAQSADGLAAMLQAAPLRLRPILMTSAAMVLGMLPTALGRGFGSEFRAPMAVAVIGGVLTSTVLTLWVVPVVFVWIEGLRGAPRAG